jgi:hypothetical protein
VMYKEWQEKVKSMNPSNFSFWVLAKFLGGLGIGILLPVYAPNPGWLIAGWMLIAFALILALPAVVAIFQKKGKSFTPRK